MEIVGYPKFPGNPNVHLPCSQTPAGPNSPSQYGGCYCPRNINNEGPHVSTYFVAQSHGFCTRCLRFAPPLLTTTQGSLPADG